MFTNDGPGGKVNAHEVINEQTILALDPEVGRCLGAGDEAAKRCDADPQSPYSATYCQLTGVTGKAFSEIKAASRRGIKVEGLNLDRPDKEVLADIYSRVCRVAGDFIDLGDLPRVMPEF